VDGLTDGTFKMADSIQESFIQEGHFKGCNEQQIAWDALCWWKYYIENIKLKISKTENINNY
jgi:hypothetical protein